MREKTNMSSFIYLDHNATTPCDPSVVAAMLPWFNLYFANPGSTLSVDGRRANATIEMARENVANLIGADGRDIIFCGSATESINLALFGVARASTGSRRKIITSMVEHKAVLECCKQLSQEGFEIVMLPVDAEGLLDVEVLNGVLDERTLLVSIQAANNETGVIQDIPLLSQATHNVGALFHSDASQYAGKLPLDVDTWDVDLLSFSGHKLYGPKGVGALYLKGGAPAWRLKPLIFGGGQERGLRSGTANVPAIVGFGVACSLASQHLKTEPQKLASLRDKLDALLVAGGRGVAVNGRSSPRLPGSTSIRFMGVDSETLIMRCPRFALSNGAACSSGVPEPSHVLLAMGLTKDEAWSTVRIGLGRSNLTSDVHEIAEVLLHEYDELSAAVVSNHNAP